MATLSNNEIAKAIYLSSKDGVSPKEVVQFLARKHLLSKSSGILSALERIISQEEGALSVKAISAKKLSTTARHELVQTLKKRYSAKEIALEEKLDERLLGGVRLEVNDEVIDLSTRNKLNQLQKYLTRPA